MQDRELYQQILGLKSPWTVSQVSLSLQQQQVDVFVEHPAGTKFCCPECEQTLPCYDHTAERQWRHLDSCQFKTILHASIPRVDCPTHGVKQVNVPWAEKGSRFTILFERLPLKCCWRVSARPSTGRALRVAGCHSIRLSSWRTAPRDDVRDRVQRCLLAFCCRERSRSTFRMSSIVQRDSG